MTPIAEVVTLEYLVTALIVVLVPGTGVIYTLSYGLFSGARGGMLAAIGCTLGILPHLLASTVGLAALLHASGLAFQAVKAAGVIYLLYLAWGLWRSAGDLDVGMNSNARRSSTAIVLRGFLINILNPQLASNSRPWCCFYGPDICRLRRIWVGGKRGAESRPRVKARPRVDSARLCANVRGLRPAVGGRG